MRKWIILLFWISTLPASDQELQPLIPKLTHPLTLEQLERFINDENQLDLTKLGDDLFCTKSCCLYNFITLNNTHKGLKLIRAFDSNESAQKFLQNLNQLSINKKFNLYENPIR
jgi:hypothetical protein